nr:hypothetical protein CPGR_01602 [Mycolicibacter nonchromogenicus]
MRDDTASDAGQRPRALDEAQVRRSASHSGNDLLAVGGGQNDLRRLAAGSRRGRLQRHDPAGHQLFGDGQTRDHLHLLAAGGSQRSQPGVDVTGHLQQLICPLGHDRPGRRQLRTTRAADHKSHTGLGLHRRQTCRDRLLCQSQLPPGSAEAAGSGYRHQHLECRQIGHAGAERHAPMQSQVPVVGRSITDRADRPVSPGAALRRLRRVRAPPGAGSR